MKKLDWRIRQKQVNNKNEWSLRKIYIVKNKLTPWIQKGQYEIATVYKVFSQHSLHVPQTKFLWNRASIPKQRFILWLTCEHKLKTRDILFCMGFIQDDRCPMCWSAADILEHIFFQCEFSAKCLASLFEWLDIKFFTNLDRLARSDGKCQECEGL